MNKLLKKVDRALSSRVLNILDGCVDRRICGRSLVKYVPSTDRDDQAGTGGTGSQSTPYMVLRHIFSHVTLRPEDVFLDVGCGKGRVLAFLVREKCPCPIYGIEHNPEVGRLAQDWAKRYEQVHVLVGDALELDYAPYTVLCLARPFLPKTFLVFLDRLERTADHPLTLIYWVDQQSGHLLLGRPGWEMRHREILTRLHGVRVASSPQGYSIWSYDPQKRGDPA